MFIAAILLATILEVAGLALAGKGFIDTWREHAKGQDFWAPLKTWLRHRRRQVANLARRLIGRQARHDVVAGAGHIAVGVAASGRATVTWGPPPNPETDLREFAKVVHEHLNYLHQKVQEDAFALVDEQKVRADADEAIHKELTEGFVEVDRKTTRVAVGGLRPQVLGWWLVLLGVLANTAATLIGPS